MAAEKTEMRDIYDHRYKTGSYDARFEQVRVLETERAFLWQGLQNSVACFPDEQEITVLDFGVGTGRVTVEELVAQFHSDPFLQGKNLTLLGYDISYEGLRTLAEKLEQRGLLPAAPLQWHKLPEAGYIVGDLIRKTPSGTITVRLVHGQEDASPELAANFILEANQGKPLLMTTSWFSVLGHIPGQQLRDRFFTELGRITKGDMLLEVAGGKYYWETNGHYRALLIHKETRDSLIEIPGDIYYQTELGQNNYSHLWSYPELMRQMQLTATQPNHSVAVEIACVFMPDFIFESRALDEANTIAVQAMNIAIAEHRAKGDDNYALRLTADSASMMIARRSGVPA